MANIKDFSETEIIALIKKAMRDRIKSDFLPFGDDAVATIAKDKIVVINVDMFVRKTDLPRCLDYYCGGWKLVTMAISDVIAKGAKPYGLLLSLGLPIDLKIEDLKRFLIGVYDALAFYDIYLLGGDTNEACDFIADGIIFGFSTKKIVSRQGILEGDIIITTGQFGLTAAGLLLALDGSFNCLSSEKDIFLNAICKPKARKDVGKILNKIPNVVASIDSSDGLVRSLYELTRASNVGILIENVPVHESVTTFSKRNSLNPLDLALYGGEEFELIFAIRNMTFNEIKNKFLKYGINVYYIGQAIKEPRVLLKETDGSIKEIKERGWMHFNKKQ